MECEMIGKYHETSCAFIPDTSPILLASLCQEVSDVSDPTGVWSPLRPVSVVQNKLSLLLSFHVDAFKRVALSKVLRRSFFQPNYYLELMI